MALYEKQFTKPYPDGYVDKPVMTTPVTADILNKQDAVLAALEDFLASEDAGFKNALTVGTRGTGDVGRNSHTIGYDCVASADYSHAEGTHVTASGSCAHAEGGYGTKASGNYSHAEGYGAQASGESAHAEGCSTTASGIRSHAEGNGAKATGDYSHAEGSSTTASGQYSHAEGQGATASGTYAHAEGQSTTASFSCAHAEGYLTKAIQNYVHAEGHNTEASGQASHAEGLSTKATGYYSHTEGQSTTASGSGAHAEGYNAKATGDFAHAEGNGTTAGDMFSHAEGASTQASGTGAHAENLSTKASGTGAHAEGQYTIASGQFQHVQGQYNEEDTENKYAHIVGGGTSATDRKNIHTVDWQGNAYYAGDVTNGNGVSLDGLMALIGTTGQFRTIVTELPTEDISTETIYMVLKESGSENDIYNEYINVDGTVNGWEFIGNSAVDLTGYYTAAQVDDLLAGYVTSETGKGLSSNDYTAEDHALVASIRSMTAADALAILNEEVA
ncbi:MAG: hypothetical protein J6B43_11085 [Lachnospiraceae bacterium]|nr:hypothetical protein [Lachnospiraceae bacterium]